MSFAVWKLIVSKHQRVQTPLPTLGVRGYPDANYGVLVGALCEV